MTKFVPNSSYRSNAWVRCASGNVFFNQAIVDAQMDVNEAVPHLRHIVVSLLCTLLNIEEEAASCLLGVIEVDVQTRDGDVGEV